MITIIDKKTRKVRIQIHENPEDIAIFDDAGKEFSLTEWKESEKEKNNKDGEINA